MSKKRRKDVRSEEDKPVFNSATNKLKAARNLVEKVDANKIDLILISIRRIWLCIIDKSSVTIVVVLARASCWTPLVPEN
jgi:hypothetical protein